MKVKLIHVGRWTRTRAVRPADTRRPVLSIPFHSQLRAAPYRLRECCSPRELNSSAWSLGLLAISYDSYSRSYVVHVDVVNSYLILVFLVHVE